MTSQFTDRELIEMLHYTERIMNFDVTLEKDASWLFSSQ